MPAHDLLVIGFDSGEVQIYQGLDETGNSSPEPGEGPPLNKFSLHYHLQTSCKCFNPT
jgi:hypothetical protein